MCDTSVRISSTPAAVPTARSPHPGRPARTTRTASLRRKLLGRRRILLLALPGVSRALRRPVRGSVTGPHGGCPTLQERWTATPDKTTFTSGENAGRRGPEEALFYARNQRHPYRHAQKSPPREDAQHREHGAHRRRQDHHHRAHPLLH